MKLWEFLEELSLFTVFMNYFDIIPWEYVIEVCLEPNKGIYLSYEIPLEKMCYFKKKVSILFITWTVTYNL